MNQLVNLLCMGSGLLVLTFCQVVTQEPGNVVLPNCTHDFIDIRENQNNTLLCEGFHDRDTIVWFIQRDTQNRTPVATCGPSNCTVHQPEHFAVQRSPSHSLLFYQQYNRELDKLAKVICESQLSDKKRTKACTLNVINPATLSDCFVETNTTSHTATGSCWFEEAYSHSRPYYCTWYLEMGNDETRTVTGNITFPSISSSGLKSGVCNFSTTLPNWDPTTYSYSVSFYPGTGKIKVNIANTGTHRTDTPATTTQGIVSSSTTTSTAFGVIADEEDNKEKSSPVAAIVGGCIGGVVVIVAAVVIIAIVVKRRDATYAKPRRRQIPEHVYDGLPTTTTSTTTTSTTASVSTKTTINDQHNIALNDTQNKEEKTRNAHHNPVYVNEEQPEGANSAVYYNQVTQGYSGVQQDPTYYVNDNLQAAHDYCNGDRNSNPYYSEIKE